MTGQQPDRILRMKTVLVRTGLSKSTLYRRIAEGTLPTGSALLATLGIDNYNPLLKNRRRRLAGLRTGLDAPIPPHPLAKIERLLSRLAVRCNDGDCLGRGAGAFEHSHRLKSVVAEHSDSRYGSYAIPPFSASRPPR